MRAPRTVKSYLVFSEVNVQGFVIDAFRITRGPVYTVHLPGEFLQHLRQIQRDEDPDVKGIVYKMDSLGVCIAAQMVQENKSPLGTDVCESHLL